MCAEALETYSSSVGSASHSVPPKNNVLTTKMAAILSVAVKRIRLFEGPAGLVVPYWGSSVCERSDVLAEGDGMSCTVAREYVSWSDIGEKNSPSAHISPRTC